MPMKQKVREDILLVERDLLHVLGFDFQVDHPQGYIMRWKIIEKYYLSS
jgi:hypothetical protein